MDRDYKSGGSVITERLYIDIKQDLKKEKKERPKTVESIAAQLYPPYVGCVASLLFLLCFIPYYLLLSYFFSGVPPSVLESFHSRQIIPCAHNARHSSLARCVAADYFLGRFVHALFSPSLIS